MTKPNIIIPNSFAANGDKTDFDENHITNGFPTLTPDVLRGDNLNKFIDDTYKGLNGTLELFDGCVLFDINNTYNNKSIVFNISSDDEVEIYRSRVNDNVGNPLTDNTKWEKVEFGGANTDLSNLTTTGEKHFLNKSQITNCILEIPQDLHLVISNGVLTLKAGSKWYVPNGTGTFDVVNITTDAGSGNISSISEPYMFFINSSLGIAGSAFSKCFSGSSAPSSPTNGTFWYDTANNLVKRYNGSSWVSGFSLPICVVPANAGYIREVFNGVGYIDRAFFAVPNIKILIGDGRNSDGTLRNTEYIIENVLVSESSSTSDGFIMLNTSDHKIYNYWDMAVIIQEGEPSFASYVLDYSPVFWYKPSVNKWFYIPIHSTTPYRWESYNALVNLGKLIRGGTSGTKSMISKNAFCAVDSNVPYLVETYANGTSGYRVWSDGFKEQWGLTSSATTTFLKEFSNTNYNVQLRMQYNYDSWGQLNSWHITKSVDKFVITRYQNNYDWYACGY